MVSSAHKTPEQHGATTTCRKTGLVIPKTPMENVRWRMEINRAADSSSAARRQLRDACARSWMFWINGFCWTYRQKRVEPDGREVSVTGDDSHVPFLTWLVQDELLELIDDSITHGHDLLIDKSRDMGASWCALMPFHWRWQFRSNNTFLEVSRKESYVDKRGSMDSLFEKHRYTLRMQPPWLRPPPGAIRDNVCHLENIRTGSVIEGESTNEHVGQGARKTAILLDEFARVDNGEEIDLATRDTSACRIFNSTPNGPGKWFTKMRNSGKVRVFTMHWSRHPEKGAGAKMVRDQRGRLSWTNPWYEAERLKRSPQDVAMNLDIDHEQSGAVFFDHTLLDLHKIAHCREPELTLNMRWSGDMGPDAISAAVRKSDLSRVVVERSPIKPKWRLWCPLVDGRPSQDVAYAMGVDISTGSGHSNSVVTIINADSGAIIAKFWDAFTSPEELAECVMMAGIWFGGRIKPALCAFELNGPGGVFGRKLITSGYRRLYYQRQDNTRTEDRTERYGWHSNPERKINLLGRYREELQAGRIINPCAQAIDEAMDYVYEGGQLIPGRLREEPSGGRALHGDHVIADALALLARDEVPKYTERAASFPFGSYGWRKHQVAEQRRRKDRWE